MKAILPLPNKTLRAINNEINRQTGANVRKLSVNLQAMVLWYMYQKYGFGKKRLLDFQKDFLPLIRDLQEYYQAEDAQETEFICLYKLKHDVGIDVEKLDEMFQLQVKMN